MPVLLQYQVTGAGFVPTVGTGSITFPSISVQGVAGASAGTTFNTVSMHTEAQALSTYTNFAFNSYAMVNGVLLAAGAGGLFSVTGATDNGTAIASSARFGVTDFGTSKIKRMDRVYLGYKSNGALTLSTITDEATTNGYSVATPAVATLINARVLTGKGVEARYWQFNVANVAGADFTINSLEVAPQILKRRLRG
jgi:hypothetical protein